MNYNLKPTKDCEGETFEELMKYLYLKFIKADLLFHAGLDYCPKKEAEKHLKSYIKNLIKQQKC